jgi:predicted metal-dependent phosphoesterase TrpH
MSTTTPTAPPALTDAELHDLIRNAERWPSATWTSDDVLQLATEVARLRKLFDDAGQGEYNVLALVDHYQDRAIKADRLERDLAQAKSDAVAVFNRPRLSEQESFALLGRIREYEAEVRDAAKEPQP